MYNISQKCIVLVMSDGRAADGFGATYFSDERLAASEAGASPILCEFDPLMTADPAALPQNALDTADPAALPQNALDTIGTDEVPYFVC